MLQFDMETKRINDLIMEGAASRIDDKHFLELELRKFLDTKNRKMMITGHNYYDYEHAILAKKREVINENGKLEVDDTLPNTKYIDSVYSEMVDQKVNYLLSKPLTIKTKNEKYSKELSKIFNKRFHKTLKNLGKDSYNGGIGWLYPYYDGNGEFKIKKFSPWEILPFWKDEEHEELDFGVRIYEILGYEGEKEKIIRYVEVYDTNGIHKFKVDEQDTGLTLIPDYQIYYFQYPQIKEGEEIPYSFNWDRVPLIPFKANSTETPLIKKCKSLQDGINQMMSEYSDIMEENASGSSILIIKNYDGTDLGQFRANLSTYKAVKVRTVDGADGGIDKLEIEVNAENYEMILKELRKALIRNCKGYDIDDLKSSGSPNEMTIKSVYSDIDLDANEIETEYQAGFEQLLWFINAHLKNTGKGDFTDEEIDIIFNRDMMVNESQVITDINNSRDILSNKTLVAMHPWVDDVEAELKQIEEEKQANIEQYGMAFNTPPENNPEPDNPDDVEDEDEQE